MWARLSVPLIQPYLLSERLGTRWRSTSWAVCSGLALDAQMVGMAQSGLPTARASSFTPSSVAFDALCCLNETFCRDQRCRYNIEWIWRLKSYCMPLEEHYNADDRH